MSETRSHLSRRTLGTSLFAGTASSAILGDQTEAASPSSETSLNVRDFGASGDGTTDDTAAFEAALAQGRTMRSPVLVPDGRYRLTRPLSIPVQGMIGNPWASWAADVPALPTLLPESLDGPALTLEQGASVSGLEIRYPNKNSSAPVSRPSAIRLGETGATVRCVKISHPWIGIDTVPVHTNPGRTVVENVFIAGAHHLGIHFTGAADVCLFRNIEIWTPPETSGTFLAEGTGFHFQRGDGIRLTDCFVLGANRGFLVTTDDSDGPLGGVFTGYLSNCLTDFCNTGLEVRGDHRITITGGGNWSHHSCIRLEEGASLLQASAIEMYSNADVAIHVASAESVMLQACSIQRKHPSFSGPAIHLTGGKRVLIGNCEIRSDLDAAILNEIEEGQLLLNGNSIRGAFRNLSVAPAKVVESGNLFEE